MFIYAKIYAHIEITYIRECIYHSGTRNIGTHNVSANYH